MSWTAVGPSTITWSDTADVDKTYGATTESSQSWGEVASSLSTIVSTSTTESITTSITTSATTYEDLFDEAAETDLVAHTPDSGITGWEYNIQSIATVPNDVNDFIIETYSACANREPTGAYARSTTDVGDSSMTVYATLARAAVLVGDFRAGVRILISDSASSYTNRDSVDIYYDAVDSLFHIREHPSDSTSDADAMTDVELYSDAALGTWTFPGSADTGMIVNLAGNEIRVWITNSFTDSSYTTTAQMSVYDSTGTQDYVYSLRSDRNDGNHKRVGMLCRGNPNSGRGHLYNLYIESEATSATTSSSIVTSTTTTTVTVDAPPATTVSYGSVSVASYLPTRMKPFPDGDGGVDFLVTVQRPKTFLVSSDRPVNIASRSAISSNLSAEGRP